MIQNLWDSWHHSGPPWSQSIEVRLRETIQAAFTTGSDASRGGCDRAFMEPSTAGNSNLSTENAIWCSWSFVCSNGVWNSLSPSKLEPRVKSFDRRRKNTLFEVMISSCSAFQPSTKLLQLFSVLFFLLLTEPVAPYIFSEFSVSLYSVVEKSSQVNVSLWRGVENTKAHYIVTKKVNTIFTSESRLIRSVRTTYMCAAANR